MAAVAIVFGVFAYLGVGACVAVLLNTSVETTGPKWLVLPAAVVLWPVALLLPVVAFFAWVRNGSH